MKLLEAEQTLNSLNKDSSITDKDIELLKKEISGWKSFYTAKLLNNENSTSIVNNTNLFFYYSQNNSIISSTDTKNISLRYNT